MGNIYIYIHLIIQLCNSYYIRLYMRLPLMILFIGTF